MCFFSSSDDDFCGSWWHDTVRLHYQWSARWVPSQSISFTNCHDGQSKFKDTFPWWELIVSRTCLSEHALPIISASLIEVISSKTFGPVKPNHLSTLLPSPPCIITHSKRESFPFDVGSRWFGNLVHLSAGNSWPATWTALPTGKSDRFRKDIGIAVRQPRMAESRIR